MSLASGKAPDDSAIRDCLGTSTLEAPNPQSSLQPPWWDKERRNRNQGEKEGDQLSFFLDNHNP